ncbi:MAG: hypothetical protein AB9903_36050 [Vulcanimicrobiota bacterium]
MFFDWKEYLILAEYLAEKHQDLNEEAALRSSISRAYYSAYCRAIRYAHTHLAFPKVNDSKDHSLLRDHLRRNKRSGIAERLDKLRRWRNDCDYEDRVGKLHENCKMSLEKAREIFQYLEV